MHAMFRGVFTGADRWERPQYLSTNRWMNIATTSAPRDGAPPRRREGEGKEASGQRPHPAL